MLKAFITLFFIVSLVEAQDLSRVRSILDTLCSKEMFGRGYLNNGHLKAANYISNQFELLGLEKFDESYLQPFPITVNTFPETPSLSLDGNIKVLGKDYIIGPGSRSFEGDLEVLALPKKSLTSVKKVQNFLIQNQSNKALFVDARGLDGLQKDIVQSLTVSNIGFPVVLVADTVKSIAGLSQRVNPVTVFNIILDTSFNVPSRIKVSLKNHYKEFTSNNVIGFLKGSEYPDSFVVFSAHYDHLGGYGDEVYFPGANDNASGTAMILELADSLSKIDTLKYSVAFMAFGGEEVGLIGSRFYTQNPLFPLSNIKYLLNVDILGTGEDGIKIVNATKNIDLYNTMVSLNDKHDYLKIVGKRGPAANSDHHFFDQNAVPAVFIYTLGGVTAYHDIYDIPETLPLTKFLSLKKLLLSTYFHR